MSANLNIHVIDNGIEQNGGLVWNRLHSEREDICEALLKECAPGYEGLAGTQRISNENASALQTGIANCFNRACARSTMLLID